MTSLLRDGAVRLWIPGIPAPQGSKTARHHTDKATGVTKAWVTEGRQSGPGAQKHKAWRAACTAAALDDIARHDRMGDDQALAVRIAFLFPRTKGLVKAAVWKHRKPDVDKLVRATLDGLADGKVFKHDSRVVILAVAKRFVSVNPDDGDQAGAHVLVVPVDDRAESDIWAGMAATFTNPPAPHQETRP